MADKKITDLQQVSSITDDLNFPVDDTLQTYRGTIGQVKNYLAPVYVPPSVQTFLSGSSTYYCGHVFFCSNASATVGATYTNNGNTYTVIRTVASSNFIWLSGSAAPTASGTLTKSGGTGDTSIAFTAFRKAINLMVEMVGGGGGGGSTGGNGSAGGNTTFGSSFLTCNGGGGGSAGTGAAGSGGTASLGSGAAGIAVTGGGGMPPNIGLTNGFAPGGVGGASAFGGAGIGGTYTVAGGAAAANTGGGGGGAGSGAGSGSGVSSGAGGGSGAYIKAFVPSPSYSYAYAVGAGGAGGTIGAIGGGAGGSGMICVVEYYQ